MTIFIEKGDAPMSEWQIEKRTQAYIARDYSQWERERAIRTNSQDMLEQVAQWETDTDTNRANNTFNRQLVAYKAAVARLAKYVLSEGREEVKEMRPTGEKVFDEELGEMVDVMEEFVVQTAIEPLEPTVERTVYSEDEGEPSVEVIENPLITQDNAEREQAQAVVDSTPSEVKEFAQKVVDNATPEVIAYVGA